MSRQKSRVLPLLFALFFCSGLAGLGYQIVWAKQFGAGIGHEYPATLAVVTAFMSGMGLGAFFFDRLPARFKSASDAYGWLELIIASWGLVVAVTSPVF